MLRAYGFPHLGEMLATVVSRSHVADPGSANDVSSDTILDPSSITEEEATAMGGVFVGILNSGRSATPALSPDAAVLMLVHTFLALDIMTHTHVWLVPMLTTIASRLQGRSIVDRAQTVRMDRGNTIHPGLATGISIDGGVDHQVSPDIHVIVLSCSTVLVERFTHTLLEYTEHDAGGAASTRATFKAQLTTCSKSPTPT